MTFPSAPGLYIYIYAYSKVEEAILLSFMGLQPSSSSSCYISCFFFFFYPARNAKRKNCILHVRRGSPSRTPTEVFLPFFFFFFSSTSVFFCSFTFVFVVVVVVYLTYNTWLIIIYIYIGIYTITKGFFSRERAIANFPLFFSSGFFFSLPSFKLQELFYTWIRKMETINTSKIKYHVYGC